LAGNNPAALGVTATRVPRLHVAVLLSLWHVSAASSSSQLARSSSQLGNGHLVESADHLQHTSASLPAARQRSTSLPLEVLPALAPSPGLHPQNEPLTAWLCCRASLSFSKANCARVASITSPALSQVSPSCSKKASLPGRPSSRQTACAWHSQVCKQPGACSGGTEPPRPPLLRALTPLSKAPRACLASEACPVGRGPPGKP
jgi:hypothetical protein